MASGRLPSLAHEQIDGHFTPAFGPEDEERFNRFVEILRPRHLSAAEQAERDQARQAAHDELTRQEAEIAEFEQRIGYQEIEAQQESAAQAVWDAEYDVMEAGPATTAGALALLRFTADFMKLAGGEHHYVMAMFTGTCFREATMVRSLRRPRKACLGKNATGLQH